MKAVVKIENVTKIIKKRKIIDSLSFEVMEGEVFGFLGPNGAGKTTTIRMIVGLIGISEGDIKILGNSVQTNFEKAIQHVGAIVENPEMYKFMSGYQNLLHYAKMSEGITKEKIMETVEFVGLTERIHDKVKTYSLGMRQRLGLAQCLLHDPKVLILDEPTNGLDPAGIREIRDHVRKLARERGMAVIVSSHLLSEMEMMCDRVGIIQKGKLITIQSVHEQVEGGAKEYEIDVDHPTEAMFAVNRLIPQQQAEVKGNTLMLRAQKEDIPLLVKEWVHDGINIYRIQETTKTLEDRFLEVTTLQKEAE
ncbi:MULTISPECIES: ABC transporter ATP-binding protein [Cytobacillus]|uniref:ABC transporter ATP-binding protein n=1 Tax=Cytobacillus TaxID=2675230 RepID=UPI001CD41837|nr:ABC transporter ATP-binding protein [Cytobacillus kochii]MCA1025366.1 ABC transporter ATP-binding protein [Cytobacillus kochii]MCM3323276.1 ABC transporter ATP-binding protein [Cytobacillus kochii]MCM3345671.1 ABC transporter ATP-binding protein [Cytobacillus kochii]MDM5208587.1 ABC transporter ATP-binding protein [Cytobacillus kochii]